METAQVVATILGAGGGGAVLLALVNGLIKWISGASSREREKNAELATQRLKAIEERDAANQRTDVANERTDVANVKRRMTEEYASKLRRQLIENGLSPEEWPDLNRTIPAAELKRIRRESKE
jgi:hypothetical protein